MKELNFSSPEQLKIKVPGHECVLNYPAWGKVEAMEEKGENLKPEDVKTFLTDCGMKEEVFKLLTFKQVQDVYTELLGLKKS